MGAMIWSDSFLGKARVLGDAFSTLCEDARLSNGDQEGYSGDIQGCYNLRPISDHPRFGTKAFDKWEHELLHNMSKGDGVVIEVKGAMLKRIKEKRGYKGRKGIRYFYFFGVSNY